MHTLRRRWARASLATLAALTLVTGLAVAAAADPSTPGGFAHSEPVAILGYDGEAMEPFITRDGRYLLFNNRNDPPERTDLFYAERIDGRTFRYKGPLRGANSPGLDAVASVDCAGTMYFVSNRSYPATFSTIYRARFAAGIVTDVEIAPGVSQQRNGIVDFDAEVSPDGRDLYVVEGAFGPGGPQNARIALFHPQGSTFVRDTGSDVVLAAVNAGKMQYAPSISGSGLELFFTAPDTSVGHTALFRSDRRDRRDPFGPPKRMDAAPGFVEAASLSIDGRSLYYHWRDENGRFVIRRLTRSASDAGPASTCARVLQAQRR